jgi:hypothetical protein
VSLTSQGDVGAGFAVESSRSPSYVRHALPRRCPAVWSCWLFAWVAMGREPVRGVDTCAPEPLPQHGASPSSPAPRRCAVSHLGKPGAGPPTSTACSCGRPRQWPQPPSDVSNRRCAQSSASEAGASRTCPVPAAAVLCSSASSGATAVRHLLLGLPHPGARRLGLRPRAPPSWPGGRARGASGSPTGRRQLSGTGSGPKVAVHIRPGSRVLQDAVGRWCPTRARRACDSAREGEVDVKRLVICCDGTWNAPDQADGGQALCHKRHHAGPRRR